VRIILNLLLLSTSICAQKIQIKYEPSGEDIANPERGLFQYDDDREGKQEPLDEEQLRADCRNKFQTAVYRHYTLINFRNKPLDEAYLRFLERDAAIARRAGVKMIIRFAYTDTKEAKCVNSKGQECEEPDCVNPHDPPLSQVMVHLNQLQEYFQRNSDVIMLVEAGFIGAYGEWYYGHSDFGCGVHPRYGARAEVLWRLLEILPSDRMVAIRTAYHKRAVITEWKKQSHDLATIAAFANRIGYHDDGFLADATDIDTFLSHEDVTMTERDTVTMPMIGETSGDSRKPEFNPFAPWEKAEEALKRYHWSAISSTDDGFIFTKGYICRKKDKWEA
jgi:hypothetical protein